MPVPVAASQSPLLGAVLPRCGEIGRDDVLCSRAEHTQWFCIDRKSVFAFLSVLDMQDAFNRLGSKHLRGTGAQDENQQGVQARHT